jgi:hypothetical protein
MARIGTDHGMEHSRYGDLLTISVIVGTLVIADAGGDLGPLPRA